MKGDATPKGAIDRGLSSVKMSDETKEINLPELVSVRERIDNLPTLSKMAAISSFLASRDITYP